MLSTTLIYSQEVKNLPNILFEKESIDVGNIIEGTNVIEFKFKNEGKEPLIIRNLSFSCGCLTAEWPQQPILPGKRWEVIKVTYNSKNKIGPFSRTINVETNGLRNLVVISIRGTVQRS